MVTDEALARAMKALAHPRRVRIFRLLCDTPKTGLSFGSLQHATGFKVAPLVHHLREMERCGVLCRQRRGQFVAHLLTTGSLAQAVAEVMRLHQRVAHPARRAASPEHPEGLRQSPCRGRTAAFLGDASGLNR